MIHFVYKVKKSFQEKWKQRHHQYSWLYILLCFLLSGMLVGFCGYSFQKIGWSFSKQQKNQANLLHQEWLKNQSLVQKLHTLQQQSAAFSLKKQVFNELKMMSVLSTIAQKAQISFSHLKFLESQNNEEIVEFQLEGDYPSFLMWFDQLLDLPFIFKIQKLVWQLQHQKLVAEVKAQINRNGIEKELSRKADLSRSQSYSNPFLGKLEHLKQIKLRLLGTWINHQKRFAFFWGLNGLEIKIIGDQLDGYLLSRIEHQYVVLSYPNGEVIKLYIKEEQ